MVGFHPVEPQLVKAEVDDPLENFGHVALAPGLFGQIIGHRSGVEPTADGEHHAAHTFAVLPDGPLVKVLFGFIPIQQPLDVFGDFFGGFVGGDEQIAADRLTVKSIPDGGHILQRESVQGQVLGIQGGGVFHG